jgi:Ca-activated chloride channel family protein
MLVNFIYPKYLFLLAIIPLLVLLHFFLIKVKRKDAVRFANFDAIAKIRGIDLYSKNLVVIGITIVISVLIIFSLAGLNIQREVTSSAQSYVIAVDVSQSMEAKDVLPSRIDAAKIAAGNFIDFSPPGTKIAIISFSGNSFIEQELTTDKSLAKSGLDRIVLSTIGGTDPAEAIISATNVLALEDGKAMILISDGRINVGDIDNALQYAKKNNVIIHTIGVGTTEGGQTSFGISKIEEESLQSAAYSTGGKYFKVSSQEELSKSFQEVLEYKLKKVSFDMSKYMLSAVLVLLIIQYILINTKYRMMP